MAKTEKLRLGELLLRQDVITDDQPAPPPAPPKKNRGQPPPPPSLLPPLPYIPPQIPSPSNSIQPCGRTRSRRRRAPS